MIIDIRCKHILDVRFGAYVTALVAKKLPFSGVIIVCYAHCSVDQPTDFRIFILLPRIVAYLAYWSLSRSTGAY